MLTKFSSLGLFVLQLAVVSASIDARAQERSQVRDSVVRGMLLYKVEGGLSSSGRVKLAPPNINGDVNVFVTIKNIGSAVVQTTVDGCTVRLRVYSSAARSGSPEFTQFPKQTTCNQAPSTFSLDPGHSKVFDTSWQGWVMAGGRKPLGPWYFVAEVHLPDTVLELRAGDVTFDPALRDFTYKVRTSVEGIAPKSLVTRITAYNQGADTLHIDYGGCALNVQAYRNSTRTGKPVWLSSARGLPAQFVRNFNVYPYYACLMYLSTRTVAPKDSTSPSEFTLSVPTYEILADSLPSGRYCFSATLELNWRIVDLDAGCADLSSRLDPVPASRTIHGIQYSARANRIHYLGGDSLAVKLIVQNLDDRPRQLKPPNMSEGVAVRGYASASERNTHYLGARSNWAASVLQLPDFVLQAHESRTFSSVISAPSSRLYYLATLRIKDAESRDVDEQFVDLSVDER